MAHVTTCLGGRWRFTTVAAVLTSLAVLSLVAVEGQPQKSLKSKLEARVSQLLEWNTRRSIIMLSSDKFSTYVKTKPRNYSIIATFTALKPQRQCSICSEAYDEFTILANSWRYSQQYSSEIFFVKVDIDEDGMDAFQQLQLTTAPTYFHFPPAGKRKAEDKYDIARNGYQAEPLAKWIADRTGITISIMRPPNYTLLMIWIPVILLASVIGYLKRENLHMLYDTKYWAAAAMIWIFVMISGQMWNQIRGPPFAHRNPQTGEMGYFSGTSQYQFIAETYFVIVLYAVMSLGMLLLNERFSLFEDLGIQKVAPIVGLALVVLDFGYILSIFRMKYQGYPYSFLFSLFIVYSCLLLLSVLLSLQIDGVISLSYGIIFLPLWVWNAFTFAGTVGGVALWIRKKKLRQEKENRHNFIAMLQSSILQFILFVQEVLLAVNLDLDGRLSWPAVFVPLYILSVVSVVACVFSCCAKRCNVELEILGSVNLLQLIFLGIQLEGAVTWRWVVVLIPTWILLILTFVLTMLYACIQCCLISVEENQPGTDLRRSLATTSVVAFSLATLSFTIFLVCEVLAIVQAAAVACLKVLHSQPLSLAPHMSLLSIPTLTLPSTLAPFLRSHLSSPPPCTILPGTPPLSPSLNLPLPCTLPPLLLPTCTSPSLTLPLHPSTPPFLHPPFFLGPPPLFLLTLPPPYHSSSLSPFSNPSPQALLVSQLDGNLSAPYTAIFIPLHLSILFLFPTLFTRRPANPFWFGVKRNFAEAILELCPFFGEYLNTSWIKNADEAGKLSEISAKIKSKHSTTKLPPEAIIVLDSKDYRYFDIMTPD